MPWTTDNPPSCAKNWTDAEKARCVSAGNAALADGKSDEEAIFACIAAAGKGKRGKFAEWFWEKLADAVADALGLELKDMIGRRFVWRREKLPGSMQGNPRHYPVELVK